jgi:hypothetical protein
VLQETSGVNIRKPLQRWQRLLILNASGLVGAFISLFTLPSNTPVWSWAIVSIAILAVMNFFALRRFRRLEQEKPQTSSTTSTVIITLGILTWFLFEILPKILRR